MTDDDERWVLGMLDKSHSSRIQVLVSAASSHRWSVKL